MIPQVLQQKIKEPLVHLVSKWTPNSMIFIKLAYSFNSLSIYDTHS